MHSLWLGGHGRHKLARTIRVGSRIARLRGFGGGTNFECPRCMQNGSFVTSDVLMMLEDAAAVADGRPTRSKEIGEREAAMVDDLLTIAHLLAGELAAVLAFQFQDVTPLRVLRVVARKGPITAKGIALELGMTRARTSDVVAKLDEDGLIEIRTPPSDRRKREIVLSERGCKRARLQDEGLRMFSACVFDPMEEPDREKLRALINKLFAGLEIYRLRRLWQLTT